MGDSGDKSVIGEASEKATSLGANVAKTAAEEVVNIAAGVGGALIGKKPKTKEELELERMKREKEEEEEKALRRKRMELRMLQEAQRTREKTLAQKKEEEEKVLPKPSQIKQLQRARIPPPAIAKTRTELKGGWGAG